MKLEEMRQLEIEELQKDIEKWKKEFFVEKMAASREKKAKKPHIFSFLRKRIARAYTVIRQKERGLSCKSENG